MGWMSTGLAYVRANWVQLSLQLAAALAILIAAALLGGALGRLAERRLRRRGGRTEALASVTHSAVRTVVLVIGVITALDQVGVNVTTLIAGAGVLGLAVGFGAQSLVKDVISGFFLIFDGAINEGDIADVGGGAVGVVESVGLRVTQIRSFNGQLWYVHNGQIVTVGNFNRDWTRAVVDVGLAYEQDASKGLKVLKEVGDAVGGRERGAGAGAAGSAGPARAQRLGRGRAAGHQGQGPEPLRGGARAPAACQGGLRRGGRRDPLPPPGHLPPAGRRKQPAPGAVTHRRERSRAPCW